MEPPQVGFVAWGCWGTGQDLAHQMKCLSRRGWALLLGLSRLDCLDLSWNSKVMSWMCVFCGSLCFGALESGIQLSLVPNIKRRAQVMSETAFMWLCNILQLQWVSLLFRTRKVRLLLLLVLYLSDWGFCIWYSPVLALSVTRVLPRFWFFLWCSSSQKPLSRPCRCLMDQHRTAGLRWKF